MKNSKKNILPTNALELAVLLAVASIIGVILAVSYQVLIVGN